MEQIPRDDNFHADALAKLASTRDIDTLESIPVEYLEKPTIEEEQAYVVTGKESWMAPYQNYIQKGELPTNKKEARRVVYKAAHYVAMDGVLYKSGFSTPSYGVWARKKHYEVCLPYMRGNAGTMPRDTQCHGRF
uniref:Uncharacterized protein n=1 Tax=Cannabis sativa TaxID=3483 RepID=A0A803PAT3_CANSA